MRAILAALLIVLVAGPAVAQSCADAQRALAAAQGGGGGREAAALRQQAQAFGCNAKSMFGRAPQCAGIEARLNRASGGADGRTVRRLRAEVSTACAAPTRTREPQRVVREPRRDTAPNGRVILHDTRQDNQIDQRAGNGNFFSRLFGEQQEEVIIETVRVDPAARTRSVDRQTPSGERQRRAATPGEVRTLATAGGTRQLREGGYRTMCVRLCDGFYFPINSRSHSDNFYEELAMCVGRCPGTDVSLYVHDANGAVEGMRSAMTGEHYVSLPTAFVYRKSLVPDCGCEPQTTIAAGQTADKALSYMTAAGTGAADVAEAAAAPGGWTPLQAVYDETGKPLDLSIGVEQVARAPASTSPASTSTAAVGGAVAGEMTPMARTPVATSSVARDEGPAAELGDDPSTVRTVGGQFFSDAPTVIERGSMFGRARLPGAAGAVTIVPLKPGFQETKPPTAASSSGVPAQTSAYSTATTGG